MDQALHWATQLFLQANLSESIAAFLGHILLLVGIFLIAFLADWISKKLLVHWIKFVVAKTDTQWDDVLVEQNVLDRLAHLAPATVIYALIAFAFPNAEDIQSVIQHACIAYMILIAAMVIDSLLNAAVTIYRSYEVSKTRPIKSYVQVLKIFIYCVTAILIIATLLDRSPWAFLSGLGAMTAILLLVFKDTILGLVASIQLTANNMVQRGDWIEVPKYGADGDVLDVSLNTVKIQNWDKTISTIPTYALMSETFKNWRGMNESGGRRIKRAIYLDMNSVCFCDDALLQQFQKFKLLNAYIAAKKQEVEKFNREQGVEGDPITNGRKLTNLGTFRAYVVAYLKQNPNIHPEMTFLVRQLPPGPHGIGIEIYVFSQVQAWAEYENIQADIFDHLLAILPEFRLRVFQNPSGADFRSLSSQ